ncbi:6037_t:CDS:2 [Scutellospora calospora]|uniref:6037_t:CDS:1 n=1 Tax=Scutellospora calospora TaxID=85575 RepID=A0ACA9K1P6_9GLOM|nr:6037_t:CDS:2 [Scutellospora calospora]
MTAVLRSLKFLEFKVSTSEKIPHSYFKEVLAQHWQLKHYLSFRLRLDETICRGLQYTSAIVLQGCEKFYQRSIDLQIAERRRLLETTIFSEQKFTEFLQASGQKRIMEDIENAASSNEKRGRTSKRPTTTARSTPVARLTLLERLTTTARLIRRITLP